MGSEGGLRPGAYGEDDRVRDRGCAALTSASPAETGDALLARSLAGRGTRADRQRPARLAVPTTRARAAARPNRGAGCAGPRRSSRIRRRRPCWPGHRRRRPAWGLGIVPGPLRGIVPGPDPVPARGRDRSRCHRRPATPNRSTGRHDPVRVRPARRTRDRPRPRRRPVRRRPRRSRRRWPRRRSRRRSPQDRCQRAQRAPGQPPESARPSPIRPSRPPRPLRPIRRPLRSPPDSSRPRHSARSGRRRANVPPRVAPSPGTSDRPGRRSTGSTPPGGRAREAMAGRRRSSDVGGPGRRRARRDRPRRPRTDRPERRPRGAVRVQSRRDDTGPLSHRRRAGRPGGPGTPPLDPPGRPPAALPDPASRA